MENKVFEKVNKVISETLVKNYETKKEQMTALQAYEKALEKAEEESDKYLLKGDMEGFQRSNKKATDLQTTVNKVRDFIPTMDRIPLLDEAERRSYEVMVTDEMNKVNEEMTDEIYKHYLEIERLAEELKETIDTGTDILKRMDLEIGRTGKTKYGSYYYDVYKPNVKRLIDEDLKRGYYFRRLKEVKASQN